MKEHREKARLGRDLEEIGRRLVLAYTLVMLLFFPLFMDGSRYGGITAAKHSLFVLLTGLSLVLLFFCALLRLLSGGWKGLGRPAPCEVFFLCYLLVNLISFCASPYRGEYDLFLGAGRNEGLLTQFLYVAVFFMLCRLGGKRKDLLLLGFGICAALLALVGILQYYGRDVLGLYPQGYDWYNADFISTLGNKNMVSAFLVMGVAAHSAAFVACGGRRAGLCLVPAGLCFFLLLAIDNASGYVGALALLLLLPLLLCHEGERLVRLLCLYGVLALGAALWRLFPSNCDWCTRSYSTAFTPDGLGLLAAGAGLALLALAFLAAKRRLFFRYSPAAYRRVWAIGLAALLLMGLALLLFVPLGEGAGPLYEAQQMLHGNFDDSFGTERLFVWKRALRLVGEHPLLGTGPDSFVLAYGERFGAETYDFIGRYYDAAHNEYLQILCNCGILGLACYLGGLISLFLQAAKGLGRGPAVGILLCTALGYCVQAFFSFSISITAPLFWITLGLLARESGRHETKTL